MKLYKSTYAILATGISAGNLLAGTNPSNIKWNVVVLMTDMHNVHYLGSDHQSRENILTPNLDKLGQDGMIFRKAYDAFPVSAPTRASLLTGTYPMKHKQFGNSVHLIEAGLQGNAPSLAHVFRNNGYNTAMLGKQHSNMEKYENVPNGTLAGKNVFVGWNYRLCEIRDGSSNHGDMMGQKERINKMVSYEGSARVPFLIRMPGVIAPGQKSDILLNHVDMFPTLAGLIGIGDKLDIATLDGKDLSQALISNNTGLGPERTFTVANIRVNDYPSEIYARSQKYKFSRWATTMLGTQPAMLLFDMDNGQ